MNTNNHAPVSYSLRPLIIGITTMVIVFFAVFYFGLRGEVIVVAFLIIAVTMGLRSNAPRISITLWLLASLGLTWLVFYVGGFIVQLVSYTILAAAAGVLTQDFLERGMRIRHK